MPKHLIVNADDLGISAATNLAIGQAFREGIVTSASLMANMAAMEHAIEAVVAPNPGLGVGVHLCLTSGKSVLRASGVPLLVDSAGRFRHGFLGLLRLVHSGRRDELIDQIGREMEAQVRRVESFGVALDHVDSHQHVHMIPGLFALAAEIAAARGAALRVADEPFRPSHRRPVGLLACLPGGVLKKFLLSRFAAIARRTHGTGNPGVRYFGVLESGRITRAVLRDILSALPDGVSEVNIHPGQGDAAAVPADCSPADRRFLASPRRAAELAALVDSSLRTLCDELRIVRTTFRARGGVGPQLHGQPALG